MAFRPALLLPAKQLPDQPPVPGAYPKHRRRPSLAATFAAASIALSAHGGGQEDQQALLAVAEDFLYQQVRHLGDDIDIELEPPGALLPPCADPRPFLPANTALPRSRVTVGVRCDGDQRVRYLAARLRVVGPYLAVSRDLAAGHAIDADSATLERGDLAALPGTVLRTLAEAAGQVTRQRLVAGTPLLARHLTTLPLVKRGERVVVESGGTGFRVSREGEVLEPGGLGDSVRVQLDRRTVIQARVSGTGRVTANPR